MRNFYSTQKHKAARAHKRMQKCWTLFEPLSNPISERGFGNLIGGGTKTSSGRLGKQHQKGTTSEAPKALGIKMTPL
jgi:hypothetical protein